MLHKILQLVGQLTGRGKLSILIYHQVLSEHDPMRPTEPTAQMFDWQMRLLQQYFTPLSLDQALLHLKHNTLPPNAVCVTFDDGYLNNLTVAQPILAKYGIPATVYIATAFSNGSNMWNDRLIHLFATQSRRQLQLDDELVQLGDWQDRCGKVQLWLKKLKYLPLAQRLEKIDQFYRQNNAEEQAALMMSPAQIKQLADCGVTIGAHTVNHPILKVLSEHEQHTEIEKSKLQLEDWLGRPVEHFAYPNGVEGRDFDDCTVNLVKQAGFTSAVITNWGKSSLATSVFKLKRFTPWDHSSILFHLRLIRNT